MAANETLLNAATLERTLARMAHEIAERNEADHSLVLLGLQLGGVSLAQSLATRLGTIWSAAVPCGSLDISLHRDDLDQRVAPELHPTSLPGDIAGKTVLLVDDVLYSGRTVRAAMDALNTFGRPKRIQLAVLVDRGHRELPIQPDFVGTSIKTSRSQNIVVSHGRNGAEDRVYLEEK